MTDVQPTISGIALNIKGLNLKSDIKQNNTQLYIV